jgi:hypothetical protein
MKIKGLRPLPPTPGCVAWGGERGAGDFPAAFFDIFGSKWCSSSQKDADVPPSCIRMFKEYVWNSKMTVLIRPSNPFTRGASQGFQETQF